MKLRGNKKGYTLIEVIIATGLSTMILAVMVSILIYSMWGWSRGVSQNTATDVVNMAMQKLANDARDGRDASVSSNILTITFPNKVTDSVTQETIYDLSTTSSVTRQYLVSNSNLIRRVNGTDTVIARGITNATFQVHYGSVNVALTGYDRSGKYSATEQANGRIFLRNYR